MAAEATDIFPPPGQRSEPAGASLIIGLFFLTIPGLMALSVAWMLNPPGLDDLERVEGTLLAAGVTEVTDREGRRNQPMLNFRLREIDERFGISPRELRDARGVEELTTDRAYGTKVRVWVHRDRRQLSGGETQVFGLASGTTVYLSQEEVLGRLGRFANVAWWAGLALVVAGGAHYLYWLLKVRPRHLAKEPPG